MVTMFLFQYVYDEVPYIVFMFSVGLLRTAVYGNYVSVSVRL